MDKVQVFLIWIKRLKNWVCRAWPLSWILIVAVVHVMLVWILPENIEHIDQVVIMLSQIGGGLLIIYSIDSNIGIIKDSNLCSLFVNYIKAFPLPKKPINIKVEGSASISTHGGRSKIRLIKSFENIDERVSYLESQLNELRVEINKEIFELRETVNANAKASEERYNKAESGINALESKITQVSIGGFKIQLFGVFLVIYGAIVDVLPDGSVLGLAPLLLSGNL